MSPQDLCNHTRIKLIASALGHQACTKTDGTEVLIPGTNKRILIGDDAYLAKVALRAAPGAAAPYPVAALPSQAEPVVAGQQVAEGGE